MRGAQALVAALVVLVAGTGALCGCNRGRPEAPDTVMSTDAAMQQITRFTVEEVERMLGRPGVFVFDANPRELYASKHVPGARWVQWDAVTAEVLPADRDATVIFYCANESCSASTEAAVSAVRRGWRRVGVMPAGIFGWKRAGKPMERDG